MQLNGLKDLFDGRSRGESWNLSRNLASMDRERKVRPARSNVARQRHGQALEAIRRDPASPDEAENLLERSRPTEEEETLKQMGRAGASNIDAPLTTVAFMGGNDGSSDSTGRKVTIPFGSRRDLRPSLNRK
jgi:hypothetical protein